MTVNEYEAYEGNDRASRWVEFTDGFVKGQRLIFAMNAKLLPTAFADCMSLLLEPLRMVESNLFKGIRGRTFLGILGLAYQLLHAAWVENEEG